MAISKTEEPAMECDAKLVAIVLPFPFKSHVIPSLILSKKIASLGLPILFINVEAYLPNCDSLGLPSNSNHPNVTMLSLPPSSQKPSHPIAEIIDTCWQMRGPFEEILQEILASSKYKVACLIAQHVVDWAQEVADKYGICRVSFSTNPATFELFSCYLPQLMDAGLVPLKEEDRAKEEFIPFMKEVLPLKPRDIPYYYQNDHPVISRTCDLYQRANEATFYLVNSAIELERDAIYCMTKMVGSYLSVGPLLPFDPFNDDKVVEMREGLSQDTLSYLSWLDKRNPKSVIYIAFGTFFVLNAEEIENIGRALQSTGQPFIWVIRPDQVLCMREEFLEDFKKLVVPGQGLTVDWAPQVEILRHPSIGGFLTHAGWNSTTESVSMGVPMLACPRGGEQNLTCKIMVEKWQIGLRINDEVPGLTIQQHKLEEGIKRLMQSEEGDEMRKRAVGLKVALRHSSSHLNLQYFVKQICSRCQP